MRLVTQHGASITSAVRKRLLNEGGLATLAQHNSCAALIYALCEDTTINQTATSGLLGTLTPSTVLRVSVEVDVKLGRVGVREAGTLV